MLILLFACKKDDTPPRADVCEDVSAPSASPRVVRLTHSQYDNAVSDLFGTPLTPSEAFIGDVAYEGFTNNAEGMTVSARLARDYRRAAEDLSALIVEDSGVRGRLLSCATEDEACAETFIRDFGRRAYRKPLAAAQVDRYLQLYVAGNGLYETGTSFEQGMRLVVEGMLQSPNFLYRLELTEEGASDGAIPLSDVELASKLSFLLWDGPPDDELLDKAVAGELHTADQLEAEARRLLDDPRAARPLHEFHRQWLEMDAWHGLSRDDGSFDPDTAGVSLEGETQRFIESVILEDEGTYVDLLTETSTWVNDDLAGFYGLDGSYPEWTRVDLDPAERSGLLTRLGFLTAHAYPHEPSPIHRGVFIQRNLLCNGIEDPPFDVSPDDLPEPDSDLVTNRQRIEHHTQSAVCMECHEHINAAGFAFENYDAVGRFRTEDNGAAVDASGDLVYPAFGFHDAVEFSEAVASEPAAERCYTENWFRYGYARQVSDIDQCVVDELAKASGGLPLKELLVQMTLTRTFTHRAVDAEEM